MSTAKFNDFSAKDNRLPLRKLLAFFHVSGVMMLSRQWPSRGRRFIVEVNERPIPMPVTNTRVSAASVPAPASTYRVALAVMTTLF
ncbi:MAG TPA: hypothetical protein VKB88_40325, partial [Bryobacteraceae bacterium]|nr:hypothetical protein [Bryobacteraceae bacterium]